jgi:hypothetical protein
MMACRSCHLAEVFASIFFTLRFVPLLRCRRRFFAARCRHVIVSYRRRHFLCRAEISLFRLMYADAASRLYASHQIATFADAADGQYCH